MLIKDLPLGSTLRMGSYNDDDLLWIKVSDNQDFVTTKLSSGRFAKLFDSKELYSTTRGHRANGNNFFPTSNICQWLNSIGEHWFAQAHEYDMSPYYSTEAGFLSCFSMNERSLLVKREITTTVTSGNIKKHGKTYKSAHFVVLPSAFELGMVESDDGVEADEDPNGYLIDLLRSSMPSYSQSVFTRTASNNPGYVYIATCYSPMFAKRPAKSPAMITPMIRLNGSVEVSDAPVNGVFIVPSICDQDNKVFFDILMQF